MSMKLYKEENVENIAEAIREPLNSSETYKIREMAPAIENMANTLKSYIPKATTEEKSFKAIPLSMKQKINGKVEQTQYEGYNLLEGDTSYSNSSADTKINLNLQIWASYTSLGQQSQPIGGNTISAKGRYYYSFTPTQNCVGIRIKHSGSQVDLAKNFQIQLIAGTTYTVSLDITGINPTVQGGYSFEKVMVYKDSIQKPYEPYVGGQTSPSPEYPQEVKTLKGVNEVDIPNQTITSRDYINLKEIYLPIGTHTINFDIETSNQYSWAIKNKNQVNIASGGNTSTRPYTFTITEEAKYITFYTQGTAELSNFMINEGNEKPYTPYGYIREDIVGKNLFNDNLSAYTKGTGAIYRTCHTSLKKGQTYTIKATKIGETVNNIVVAVVPYGNSYSEFQNVMKVCILYSGVLQTTTFTVDNTWISPKLVVYSTSENFNDIFSNYQIQLEEGSTATPYEPYQESKTNFIYIGENEFLTDDFVEVDEKGVTKGHKEWGKIIFDGSDDENWSYIPNVSSSNLFRISFFNYQKNVIIYCNYYKGIAGITGRKNFNIYTLDGTSNNLDILDNRFTSVNDFKAWLQQNPIPVYYKLATPTEIDLGKHDKLIPLQGTNDISVTATLEPSKITTTHYFDYNDIQSAMLLAEPEL